MKVAVIGATGNVGTALVRALGEEPEVTEVVGVARRRPDAGSAPYDHARWEAVDLAVPTRDDRDEDLVIDHLAAGLIRALTTTHAPSPGPRVVLRRRRITRWTRRRRSGSWTRCRRSTLTC